MTAWEEINKLFEEAGKIRKLEDLYMERGNVTREEARQWALEKYYAIDL